MPRSPAPPKTGGSGLRTGTFASQLSEKINADAMPKLRSEALAAQSANIDAISGATYTSGAYRTSLQAALDRASG